MTGPHKIAAASSNAPAVNDLFSNDDPNYVSAWYPLDNMRGLQIAWCWNLLKVLQTFDNPHLCYYRCSQLCAIGASLRGCEMRTSSNSLHHGRWKEQLQFAFLVPYCWMQSTMLAQKRGLHVHDVFTQQHKIQMRE